MTNYQDAVDPADLADSVSSETDCVIDAPAPKRAKVVATTSKSRPPRPPPTAAPQDPATLPLPPPSGTRLGIGVTVEAIGQT